MPSTATPALEKLAVVTGASSGIGRAVALGLSRHGWRTVLVARRRELLEELAGAIGRETPGSPASPLPADLSLRSEVVRAAGEIRDRFGRVDGLVNAAGAWFNRREVTGEGVERTWALNVLAPVLLSEELRPALRAAAPSRIVMISSEAHGGQHLDFDDLELTRHYRGFTAYGRSKLALVLVTHALAERYRADGISVNAVHPGFIRSEFGWNNGGLVRAAIRSVEFLAGRSVEYGARTPVRLLTDPALAGVTGEYFSGDRRVRSSEASYDRSVEARLWQYCAARFGFNGAATGPGPT